MNKTAYISIVTLVLASCLSTNIGFGQNNLSFYIDKAISNNPIILDLNNQKRLTTLNASQLIKSINSPIVSLQSNLLFAPALSFDNNQTKLLLNPNNPTDYLGYGLASSNGGQYQGLANVNKSILNKKKIGIYQHFSQEQNKKIGTKIELNKHLIEKQVIDQYLLLLNSQRLIIVLDSLDKVLNNQKEIIATLAQNGQALLADIKFIAIEIKNIQLQKKTYSNDFKANLLLLNNLCGISDTTTITVLEIDLKMNINTSTTHFIEQYTIDSTITEYNQEVKNLKYKPSINLFANGGINGVQLNQFTQRFGVSAGIGFNWLIYDGHQKDINEQIKLIQQETTTFYKQNTNLSVQNNKGSILSRINTINSQLNDYDSQISSYYEVIKLYQKSIQQAQISIINYTTVLKSILTIKTNYNQLITKKERLINEYNYWNW